MGDFAESTAGSGDSATESEFSTADGNGDGGGVNASGESIRTKPPQVERGVGNTDGEGADALLGVGRAGSTVGLLGVGRTE